MILITLLVLTLSVVLQVASAILALRLIRLTRRAAAWVFISLGLILIVLRRCIHIIQIAVDPSQATPSDLYESLVNVLQSVFFLIGVLWIRPLFESMVRTKNSLRESQKDLEHKVAERTAELTKTVGALEQEIAERKRAEEALRQRQEAEQTFRGQLLSLNEVVNNLADAASLDQLCRLAVEMGRSNLGFDRLGLWLVGSDPKYLTGTYGTGEDGQVRDERHGQAWLAPGTVITEVVASHKAFAVCNDSPLFDYDRHVVGHGQHAAASLWDGHQIIGCLCTDNLLNKRPMSDSDCELLMLYASALGHLCSRMRAAEDLRQSEEKYRKLFATVTDAITVVDSQTRRIVEVNDSALRLYGYTREEIIGLPQADLSAEPEESRRSIGEALAGNLTSVPLRFHRKKDGTVFPVEISCCTFIVGGRPVVGAIARDISQRFEAERALRESEEKYRKLFTSETDAIMILDTQTRRIVDANDSALRLYGYTREELLGLRHADITAEPEESVRSIEQLRAGEISAVPLRYHRKRDGTIFAVEVSGSTFVVGGRPVVCGITRDISQRLQAARALQESEEKYRKLFTNEMDAISILDAQTGRVIDANDSALRLYGYTRQEALQLTYAAVTSDPWDWKESLREVVDGEVSGVQLHQHRRKDGTEFPVEISASSFVLDGRQVICGIARDITERKRNEQKIRESNEALERYAGELRALAAQLTQVEQTERQRLASVLHDHLQQLLVVAKIKVGIAMQDLPPDKRGPARNASAALDQALGEAKTLTTQLSPPILYERGLGQGLKWLARWMREQHGLDVAMDNGEEVEVADEHVRITLFEAARELLFNVSKHAQVGAAQVRLGRLPDGQVEIVVSDNGVGFDPACVRPLERTSGGFGLFSIRERIQWLGGSLQIDSAPGRGARISLVAPLNRAPAQAEESGA